MGYSIDLNQISALRYRDMLKSQNLLPSRRMLLDNLDEYFRSITDAGIHNLAELKSNITSSGKLSSFSAKTNIPESYLTLLKREMGSLEQKPVSISDFPGIPAATITALSGKNIKTSKDIYHLAMNPDNIVATSRETGVTITELQELNSLCDLVRINGVGAIAARTMYEGGYRSVIGIAHAKASELLESMNAVNLTNGITRQNSVKRICSSS